MKRSHILSVNVASWLTCHDNVGKYIHWKLCKKYNIESKAGWYEHSPKRVVESNNLKILWDCVMQCDKEIEARRPDIVIIDKVQNEVKIIDVAIHEDGRVPEKELEKVEQCGLLKDEIARLWDIRKVSVISVVVGALGAVSTRFEKFVKDIGITLKIEHAQKTALFDTARMLRLVLSCSKVESNVIPLMTGSYPQSHFDFQSI